jgi:glycerophosphoryl diester phosphodiesterase
MNHKRALVSLCFLFYLLVDLASFSSGFVTPLLLPERHLFGTVHASFISADQQTIQPDIDLFNGDFPIIMHANLAELSLYSGSPYVFPAFVSFGTTNQIGYMDAYREHTPFALLSLGYRTNIYGANPLHHEGWFTSWGFRLQSLSGGVTYFPWQKTFQGVLGISYDHIGLSLMVSDYQWKADVVIRTESGWSIGVSVATSHDHEISLTIGAGLSRKMYPSNILHDSQWDMLIAHRGSLQYAPENTEEAFSYALKQPQYIGIETDIRKTSDDHFVLVHDASLLRYRHGLSSIEEMTAQQLLSLDMGTWFDSEFRGAQMLDLYDLAKIANAHPDTYWLLEIKDTDWSRSHIIAFLTIIEQEFDFPHKIAFYTVDETMLELFQSCTGRPVGLQLDSVKMMLFLGDHIPHLIDEEIDDHLTHADFFTILSSKYDRFDQLIRLADSLHIPVMFWNFHDTIFGYIPQPLKQFPLGLEEMNSGTVLLEEVRKELRDASTQN